MLTRRVLVLAAFVCPGLSGCISWKSPPEGWPAYGMHLERDLGFAMVLPGAPWRLHVAQRSQGLVALLTTTYGARPLYQVEVSEEGRVRTSTWEVPLGRCPSRPRLLHLQARRFCNLHGLPFIVRCNALPFHCSFRFRTAVARVRLDLYLSEEHLELRGPRWRPTPAATAEILRIVDGIRLLRVPDGQEDSKVPAPTQLAGAPIP